jgi:hypothetical protein
MRDTIITTSQINPQTGLAELMTHTYPFDSIPLIESRVQPHYAIYDLGKKLVHLFGTNFQNPPKIPGLSFWDYEKGLGKSEIVSLLVDFARLYKRWMCFEPQESFIVARKSADTLPLDPAAPEYLDDGIGPFDSASWRGSVKDGQDNEEDDDFVLSSTDIEHWRQNVRLAGIETGASAARLDDTAMSDAQSTDSCAGDDSFPSGGSGQSTLVEGVPITQTKSNPEIPNAQAYYIIPNDIN